MAASFDFQRPLRFEDEFEVQLRIAEMTQKTIRYECCRAEGRPADREGHHDDRLRAQDADRCAPIEIPEEIAACGWPLTIAGRGPSVSSSES